MATLTSIGTHRLQFDSMKHCLFHKWGSWKSYIMMGGRYARRWERVVDICRVLVGDKLNPYMVGDPNGTPMAYFPIMYALLGH